MADSGSKSSKTQLQKNLSRRVSFNEGTLTKSGLGFPHDTEAQQPRRPPCCPSCHTFCNSICAWALLIIVILLFILLIAGVTYFSILQSNLPEVHLQRIDVNRVEVNRTRMDTLLTADVQVRLNATNKNGRIALSYSRMSATLTTEGINLGTENLESLKQNPGTSSDIMVRTAVRRMPVLGGAADELVHNSNDKTMMVDVVLKGHIDFFVDGRNHMTGFPIRVVCVNVDQWKIDNGNAHRCDVKMNL
ncbi:hypothetical protein RD792_010225 [Penstemon davidsonii]|uniref:Late embryogenesis abundant protein LEA-2 subgroup domain-containing protein n=1 Tax=Penstemon davidsonii TaxID=160366 RepID=A0ABR0D195_9LAMI|nr:hypothetical protein RD792_010225 [Penstemon davidsonii]